MGGQISKPAPEKTGNWKIGHTLLYKENANDQGHLSVITSIDGEHVTVAKLVPVLETMKKTDPRLVISKMTLEEIPAANPAEGAVAVEPPAHDSEEKTTKPAPQTPDVEPSVAHFSDANGLVLIQSVQREIKEQTETSTDTGVKLSTGSLTDVSGQFMTTQVKGGDALAAHTSDIGVDKSDDRPTNQNRLSNCSTLSNPPEKDGDEEEKNTARMQSDVPDNMMDESVQREGTDPDNGTTSSPAESDTVVEASHPAEPKKEEGTEKKTSIINGTSPGDVTTVSSSAADDFWEDSFVNNLIEDPKEENSTRPSTTSPRDEDMIIAADPIAGEGGIMAQQIGRERHSDKSDEEDLTADPSKETTPQKAVRLGLCRHHSIDPVAELLTEQWERSGPTVKAQMQSQQVIASPTMDAAAEEEETPTKVTPLETKRGYTKPKLKKPACGTDFQKYLASRKTVAATSKERQPTTTGMTKQEIREMQALANVEFAFKGDYDEARKLPDLDDLDDEEIDVLDLSRPHNLRRRLMDSSSAVGIGAVAACGVGILGYLAYRAHRFWTAKRRPQDTDDSQV